MDRLKSMGLTLDSEAHSKYIKLQGECNTKARDADMCPNNNQFACAVYIVEKLKPTPNEKKIVLSMPPGEGKSRITVALLHLMLTKTITTFTILFSHDAIMKADEKSLRRLETQWSLDIRCVVYQGKE